MQGLRTVIYKVDDLEKAKLWYANVLGFEPYFDQPFYVGFNVGGFELGLDPDYRDVTTGNNVLAYWGVENIEKTFEKLLESGAEIDSEVTEVGEGIKVATVKDPFGNIFGIIENPHFEIKD
jgi:predicted enzyme related to lactoylglutathione lyase